MSDTVWTAVRESGEGLGLGDVVRVVEEACPPDRFSGRRVLLIIPDGTRTAPVGLLFQALYERLAGRVKALDVLVALGTHAPMSEEAICERLEISPVERRGRYRSVRFFNHRWDDPEALCEVGVLSADEVRGLTDGLFAIGVRVRVNRLLFEYDEVILVGPVFPHEVVGFSGGNKYLFPGVSGPEVLNFFHWLGAVITTPRIIGHAWTPVRRVIDRAAAMVGVSKLGFSLVVDPDKSLRGVYAGNVEAAWAAAVGLSRQRHVRYVERPYHTIVSCAPAMYDELWTGGKCMYKLEPVLADGGELIIYAPHIREVSVTHGRWIEEIGYHCRDYFLAQWDRFKGYPWGVLAHSVHVHGLGTFESGVERRRAQVTLATGISAERCARINLGHRDPATVRLEDYAGREAEGVLLVPQAGEMLFRLHHPPPWAA
jgi:lactate racemase